MLKKQIEDEDEDGSFMAWHQTRISASLEVCKAETRQVSIVFDL